MSHYDKVYDWVTRPIAESFVRLFPRGSIHPNTITWIGFSCALVGTSIFLSHSADDLNHWQWLLMSFTLFIYNITDAMDGLIARREGISSCEGEVMDHMIDSIATIGPLSLGWVNGSVLIFIQRFLLGQLVFLLAHIHHRIAGGRLVQGIWGFGVDASELLASLLCLIWAFEPTGALRNFVYEFFTTVTDFMIYGGGIYFTSLILLTLFEKKCWSQCFDKDFLSFLFYVVTSFLWAPTFHGKDEELGTHVIAIAFTMPLYFFRILYLRLESLPDNGVFARRHKALFLIVGHVLNLLLLLHGLTLLPVPVFQRRRAILWHLQAVVSAATSMATLWTVHIKGPDLKGHSS